MQAGVFRELPMMSGYHERRVFFGAGAQAGPDVIEVADVGQRVGDEFAVRAEIERKRIGPPMGEPVSPTLLVAIDVAIRPGTVRKPGKLSAEIKTGSGSRFGSGAAASVLARRKNPGTQAKQICEVIPAGCNFFFQLGDRFVKTFCLPPAVGMAIFVRMPVNHQFALPLFEEAAEVIDQAAIVGQRKGLGGGRVAKAAERDRHTGEDRAVKGFDFGWL